MQAGQGASECGVHELDGRDRGDDPFVEVRTEKNPNGHDGFWYVGKISAAFPARP
jgi:hypothetical protein